MPRVQCKTCSKVFEKKSYEIKVRPNHYCCHPCYAVSLKGKMPVNIEMLRSSKPWLGKKLTFQVWNKGKKLPYPPWNKGLKGVQIAWNKGIEMPQMRGENHPNWKGGGSISRETVKYKRWRTLVFEKDNYTCQHCGARSGKGKKVILNADHIKPFALYPDSRFILSNGRTICLDCHKKTPSYVGSYQKNIVYLSSL